MASSLILGDAGTASAASKRLGIEYPIFTGNLGAAGGYGVESFPTTVVVGSDGMIEHYVRGRVDYETLHDLATHPAH